MGEKLADKMRDKTSKIKSEREQALEKQEKKEKREANRRKREYVAKHTGEFILDLTRQAEAEAEAGETTASIERTVGKEDNHGLRETMSTVRDHFIEEGFDAKTTYKDNFHYEYHGSDGEEPIWPTRFTHGVELNWDS